MAGLSFEIKAFAAFGSAFASLGRAVRDADGQMDGLSARAARFGNAARSAGTKMSLAMTLPVGAFLGDVTRTAAGFETSMNRVAAISQANETDLARLTETARKMGSETAFSAAEAADAMGFLAMAGFDVDKNIASLPGTLNLAAAGQIDLASAADIASNVLTGYALGVEEMGRVVDVMVKASTKANTNVEQLGAAMKYAAPLASSMGIDFEVAAAAIGKMSDAGIQGEQAGVALRGALTRLIKPPKMAQDALDALGVTVTDATGKLRPLDEIVAQLGPHVGDTANMMALFGQEAGPAMIALVKGGAPALNELTDALRNSGGTAERVAKTQMQGFNGQVKAMSSAFDEVKLAIADAGLLDAMTKFAGYLRDAAVWFGELSPKTQEWSLGIAAAAAVLGPLVVVVGLFVAAIVAIGAPIALGVLAVAALAAGVVMFGDDIMAAYKSVTEWAEGVAETIGGMSDNVVAGLVNLKDRAVNAVTDMVKKIKDVMIGKMSAVFDSVKEKISAVGDAFYSLWDRVVGHSYVPDLVDGIEDEFGRLDKVMVDPAKKAAGEVSDTFDDLGKSVADMLGGAVGAGISGNSFDWRGALGAIGGKLVTSAVGGFLDMRAATTPGTGGGGSGGFGSSIITAAAGILAGVLGGGTAFAAGGVFTSPTAFSMGGSGLGVMAENGPEAIMPLVRGPGGRLGVAAAGGGGGGVSVNIGVIDARGATDPAAVEAAVARAVAISTARIVPMVRDMRRDGMI
jgi:TP901 family phage tail tape measure protein